MDSIALAGSCASLESGRQTGIKYLSFAAGACSALSLIFSAKVVAITLRFGGDGSAVGRLPLPDKLGLPLPGGGAGGPATMPSGEGCSREQKDWEVLAQRGGSGARAGVSEPLPRFLAQVSRFVGPVSQE